jgi:hypothetical protein
MCGYKKISFILSPRDRRYCAAPYLFVEITDVWLGPRQAYHVAGAVNILNLLHGFLLVVTVERDIVFIHDAVFFLLARVCVCVCVSFV